MQFTFSVDQPLMPATSTPCQKPDLKPSAEFKDNKRARPSTRASQPDTAATNDKTHDDQPFTQRGRKHAHHGMETITITNDNETASLRFPSLFSSDFGPSALLYPSPTLDRKSTRLNSSHSGESRMPSSA